jgi:hypothetical protein
VRYDETDLLILDILGKDNPSLEGLDSDDCFQAYKTVADKQQAELPTSELPVDIPSPSSVRDDIKNTYSGLTHRACHPLHDIALLHLANTVLCVATATHLECDLS